ncbi:MAG: Fumarylpyruvate hydrolase [Hyphomicrobiaceae bacterium hypho_1]
MTYVFEPLPQPALPIVGDNKLFPVRHIYCVGRNYAEHARELGHDSSNEPPLFFQKNPDNLLLDSVFPLSSNFENVQWEIELVVALKSAGSNITKERAKDHIFGYGVGLDLTRRNLQKRAKEMGHPWETSKAFDKSAPCTPLVTTTQIGYPEKGAIWLEVNGVRCQESDISKMIWTIPEQIAHLSYYFELCPGDLIFTGTPAGVGSIKRGDFLKGHIDGLPELNVTVK